MSNLIRNELTKIFKKKGIYIGLIIILACIIFTNFMNKYGENLMGNSYSNNIESMKQNLTQFNPDNPSDTSIYINLETMIEERELIQKYGEKSWQATIIREEVSNLLTEMNTCQYGVSKNPELYKEKELIYIEIIKKLDNNDWKYFAKTELEKVTKQLEIANLEKNSIIDKSQIKEAEEQIANLEDQKRVLIWRLEKDISYARGTFNNILLDYSGNRKAIREYESNKSENHQDKLVYQRNLKQANLAEYSIKNNVAITNYSNARSGVMNFFEQNIIYIIAIAIMIAGTIVSEEFSKGTIKLLLVRPYKRWQILLSKFITSMIIMVIAIVIILIMQIVVGGIIFGFESLKTPAVIYNFTTNQVQTMNLFAYFGLMAICSLPMIILLTTLAFAIGTIFNNTAIAIIVSLLGFMASSTINMMATELRIRFYEILCNTKLGFSTIFIWRTASYGRTYIRIFNYNKYYLFSNFINSYIYGI